MKTCELFKGYPALHYSVFSKEHKRLYETTFDETLSHMKNTLFLVFY